MLPRLSHRILRLVIVVFIIINLIIFGTKYLGRSNGIKFNLGNPHGQPTLNLNSGLLNGFGYEKRLKKKFQHVQENKHRYWLANTGLTETKVSLPIKPFLKNIPAAEYEDANSWLNKNEVFYDPRFTLSVFLNAIKNNYVDKAKSKGQLGKAKINDLGLIKLPFNWVDWMDMTILNEDLRKPVKDRINCQYIRKNTNNDPDTDYFCFDSTKYSDDQIRKMGYRSRDQIPGFVIHGHSTHDDRPYNDFRVLEARSYAYTQHLPRPLQVVILNNEGGTYEFAVDSMDYDRLILSNLVHQYMESHYDNRDFINDEATVEFNHLDDWSILKKKVAPRHLTDAEDVTGMYKTLKKSTDPKQSREVTLTSDMFNYPRQKIADQLSSYHSRDTKLMSANERMYFESLEYCSKFENEADEETYFKMAVIRMDDDRNRDREWGWHYDWRFFNGALNYDRIGWNEKELNYRSNIILDRLLRNWNRFAEEKGIVSWIMHGPLLSWYWDGLMFPFDLDIDIQMPMSELLRLAKDFNQTLVVEDPSEGYGKYFIDVGTFIHNRVISSKSNHIDARFVDVESGIYIDITALAKSKANPPEEYDNNGLVSISKPTDDENIEIYNDRRKHFYTREQLSPLKYSMLGGVPVFIPSVVTDRLIFEYPQGLTNFEFHGWYFVNRMNLWLKQEQIGRIFKDREVRNSEGEYDRDKLLKKIAGMTDNDIFRLLDGDDEILIEYYLTKELTDLHDLEKQFLLDSLGRDNQELDHNEAMKEQYNKFVSSFKMSKPLRKSLWDYETLERAQHHIA